MALVAYDNSDSDSSVYDDADEVPSISVSKATDSALDSQETSSIFKSLPPTKQKSQPIEEEDDEFLRKKAPVKQKARITVPSLKDFKDIESNTASKPKVNHEKKSGLLSILPEPRSAVRSTTSSFIPNVLKQKSKSTNTKGNPAASFGVECSDDDSENEDTDFFSINKKHELPEIDEAALLSLSAPEVSRTADDNAQTEELVAENEVENISGEQQNTGSVENMELDDEAIRQLCGSRGRRKKEDIQILHINQEEVLAEAQEIYRKGLLEDTSKRVSLKRKGGNEPTNQQRRKHQITYLAHQAKVNEVELQNQWASSRMSRRKTQAKYGF